MREIGEFHGFTKDTFAFLMELGFNNDRAFFDANRERCREVVQDPMRALAAALIPKALEIDPEFNTKLTTVVSRMNRDTRFSKNKLPYRDHAWLGFRYPNTYVSESMSVYFEIDTRGYGYGMGMYGANPELMRPLRARAAADPERLIELSAALTGRGFTIEGDMFKRDRFPDMPEAVKQFTNRKGISWCYYSTELSRTLTPGLVDEVKDAFDAMKPLFRFVTGK